MKKFLFSLEKVLSFKQQTLDIKINELAMLQMKLHEAENEIDDMNQKFAVENKKIAAEMQKGMTANTILIYKTYMSGLNEKTQKLLKIKQQMLEIIAQKEHDVMVIKSEISGLEKLKEKQWIQYSRDMQKLQELAIEEFVSQARSRV